MTNKIYSEHKQLETGAAKFRVWLNSCFSSWHGEKYLGNKKGGISCNRTEIRGFNHPESFKYTKVCQLTAVLNLYYFLCLFKIKPDKTVFRLKNFKYCFKYKRQMFTVLFFKTAKEIKMYKKTTISSNDSIQMSVCI